VDRPPARRAEFVCSTALGVAVLLTAALAGLLTTPAPTDAGAGAVYLTLLRGLQACTVVAWGAVLVAWLRRLRRRP
jgi:hypothetical protein